MKTSFFARYVLSKEKKEDIKALLTLDEALFLLIEKKLIKHNSVREIADIEIRNLVNESGDQTERVIDSLNSFNWIVQLICYEFKESIVEIIDDFKEIFSDSLNSISDFDNRFERIGKLVMQYSPLYKAELAKRIGAPYLKRTRGTVVIKPVFEERFDFDTVDIKKYNPKLIKKTASILLELKNSIDKSFVVQFDAIEFEKFINELIALQIELKAFENECN